MIAGKTYQRKSAKDRIVKVLWADDRTAIVEDLTHGTRLFVSCSFYDQWREQAPIIKRAVYLNIYEDFTGYFLLHSSREAADRTASPDRLGCIRVDLEFEEGRFDE